MVDRCVCQNITLTELKRLHEAEGLDLRGLTERTGCCRGCGLCEPYVRLMLKTGRTSFGVLSPAEVAEVMQAG